MADGDEEKTEGSIDSNTVNSLNDSISLLVNNLNNLNSAVNDQTKTTSKASDVMGRVLRMFKIDTLTTLSLIISKKLDALNNLLILNL